MLTRMHSEAHLFSGVPGRSRRLLRAWWARLPGSPAPLTVGIATAVVYLLLATSWAFASPIYSIPDEYDHAVKAAAVVRGEVLPTSVTIGERVTVPAWLDSTSWKCFAGRPSKTADCQDEMTASTAPTPQTTTAGRYPPFYYALLGWPTLFLAGSSAFYLQREITVLLAAILLGLAAWSAATTLRSGRVLLALGIAVTPMTVYFMGGVNPQAPEIAAAAGVWISGWAVLQPQSGFNSGVITRLTVSACALALCRPLSVLWLFVIVVTLLIGFSRTSHLAAFRGSWYAKICALAIFVASLTQVIWVASTGALTQGLLGVHMSTVDAIKVSMSHQFWWVLQMIGQFGWLDTIAWPPVYLIWFVAVTCVVITGFWLGSKRERLALALLILACMVVPTTAEVATREQTGFAWQGRYTLPMAIGVVLLSGMIASRRFRSAADGRSWDRVARIMIVPLVGVAHFVAWGSALERYSLGSPSSFPFGDDMIRWSPPGGVWVWILFMGLSSMVFIFWLQWVSVIGRSDEIAPVGLGWRTCPTMQ